MHLRAWIFIDDALGGAHGGAIVLHLVLVIGGCSQDRCGLCVGRERVGEFDRACDRIVLDGLQILLAYDLQLLAICVNCGVTRGCRLSVCRVSVGRALVLFGRLAEILVLEEKVSHPVVDGRRLGVLREGIEVVAVPAESFLIIRKLLFRFLRALILSVIMRRKVLQVSLQIGRSPPATLPACCAASIPPAVHTWTQSPASTPERAWGIRPW